MFALLSDPAVWASLLTLTALEIVLGVDNIIFISILSNRLPADRRNTARISGLGLALFGRIALLLSLTWVMRLTTPLFSVVESAISGRDIIMISGGLFLLAKSTHEIHAKLEGGQDHKRTGKAALKIAVDLCDEGLITEEEAVSRVEPGSLDQLLHPSLDPDAARDDRLKQALEPFTTLPPYDESPEAYRDWGAETDFSLAGMGPGECAA